MNGRHSRHSCKAGAVDNFFFLMNIFSVFRSIFVLLLVPLLTLLVSVTAIIAIIIFRVSAAGAQAIPRAWGKIICRVSGVPVSISGLEKLDAGQPYIFAGNHQSQFDIFALQGYLDHDFRWMAKKELFKIPLFGWGMRLAGYIPVDRARGRQAIKSLEAAARRIAAGTSVIIFPEGTRSRDGALHPFKAGGMVLAIKAGVPLVPMAISGSYHVLPKGRLLARSGRINIRLGAPIETKSYSLKQKNELAERLRGEVALLLEQIDEG